MARADQRHPNENPKLNPGEYLPLRAMAFQKNAGESQACSARGTRDESITAYLFQYNFEILTAPELSGINEVVIGGENVTIYAPFRSRAADPRFVEPIEMATVPHRPNTTPPDFDSLSASPVQVSTQEAFRRADSLRIDCFKELPYEFAAGIAAKVIGLVRSFTNQWWINHGREHSRTHSRHWFQGNELGERLSGVGTFAFFYGKMGFERTLDAGVWSAAIQALAVGKAPRLSSELFLDAVYFHSADDLRRSILELAISNEMLLSEVLERWRVQGRIAGHQISHVVSGNNYLTHLDRAGRLWNRSFKDELSREFDWIKATWIARGNIAHGGTPTSQGNRELTLNDMPSMFASSLELRKWLDTI
jgi:hypothetical protein